VERDDLWNVTDVDNSSYGNCVIFSLVLSYAEQFVAPSECCVEYKLIQLYQKSSVWCFASSRTSTFELIPAVAMALPGAVVTELVGL